ncbi:MAG: hypothetical protein QME47_07540, partial [Candidatus Thermoplasmatota archaeon]|nr:hypothetical protein [Candidatus Thermoplasmatota archaeon]
MPQRELIFQFVRQKIPEPFQERFLALVMDVVAECETRWKPKVLAVIPFYPKSGELGLVEITPVLAFNISTFRKNYTATGWQIGPVAADFTTSKNTQLVIGGLENREAVPRTVEIQWT